MEKVDQVEDLPEPAKISLSSSEIKLSDIDKKVEGLRQRIMKDNEIKRLRLKAYESKRDMNTLMDEIIRNSGFEAKMKELSDKKKAEDAEKEKQRKIIQLKQEAQEKKELDSEGLLQKTAEAIEAKQKIAARSIEESRNVQVLEDLRINKFLDKRKKYIDIGKELGNLYKEFNIPMLAGK